MEKAVAISTSIQSMIKCCEAYVHGQNDYAEVPEAELYEKYTVLAILLP